MFRFPIKLVNELLKLVHKNHFFPFYTYITTEISLKNEYVYFTWHHELNINHNLITLSNYNDQEPKNNRFNFLKNKKNSQNNYSHFSFWKIFFFIQIHSKRRRIKKQSQQIYSLPFLW